jgi:hypothetical protein
MGTSADDYTNGFPGAGGDRGPKTKSTAARREGREIVGGYAVDLGDMQTSGSIAGGGTYAPVFDPYRQNDLRRILSNQVNQGAIDDLQLALIQAGLLDEGDVAFGYLDDTTQDAFGQILALANQNGMQWQDVLSQAAAGGGIGGNANYGGGGGKLPDTQIVELPNRDDLRAALGDTGMSLTGVTLDDDLIDAATESVLDTMRTQQERKFQQEVGATGALAFTESAGDPTRLLEEEVRQRAPDQVVDKGARDTRDAWFSALQGVLG